MEFTYQELYEYSEGFRERLGSGSFGDVFLGTLSDTKGNLCKGTKLAIKASHATSNWEASHASKEMQWNAEITHLSGFDHPNIIKLYGHAKADSNRYIIYEFMPNGTVGSKLQGKDLYVISNETSDSNAHPHLDWSQTKKIAIDSAAALKYLHEKTPPLVFRDFKAGNVLIDEEFNAKLSDFGLIIEEKVKDGRAGTYGCVDSVTRLWGYGTRETDVYSMGVFLMVLFTKQKTVHIVRRVKDDIKGEREVIHHKLKENGCDNEDSKMLITLALQCVNDEHSMRPTIDDIINQLHNLK